MSALEVDRWAYELVLATTRVSIGVVYARNGQNKIDGNEKTKSLI